MAAGNRHLGYKEVLNALEDRSPGSKAAFLDRLLRPRARALPDRGARGGRAGGVPVVRRPDHRRPCARSARCGSGPAAFRPRVAGRAPSRRGSRRCPDRSPRATGCCSSTPSSAATSSPWPRAARSTATPASSSTTRSSARDEGVTVRTTMNARMVAVRPTLSEYILKMPRGAQVIYPKDLGPILMLADVFPGAQVLESGVGSGALTMTLLRAIGPAGSRPRLRAARRLRRPGPSQRRELPRPRRPADRSRCATSTTASRSTTSTASSSTSPSRGGW